jgi:hypothetical protein
MLERFTEKARRAIFFARYEASQFGCSYIETEHLLLGVFREDQALASKFLASSSRLEVIRHAITERGKSGVTISTSVDLPLSRDSQRVLEYAAEESESMNHQHVGTPHLLLGLLREEKSFAAQLLGEQGLTLDSVREHVGQSEPQSAAAVPMPGLDRWLSEQEARGGLWTVKRKRLANGTTHFAIYANHSPEEPRIPLLCIEIIRDDRFSEVQKRCDGYIAQGVPQVWLLDPANKRAYTVTSAEGLREFKGAVLETASPPLEMDLSRIFD